MDYTKVDSKYCPVPFWSWNDKLNVKESIRQTKMMHQAGIGGYFMHARGGLQTEYMGKEWFDNIGTCIKECNKRGMHAWAYDENGWPSGFGGGRVNAKGEKYWQKYLRYAPIEQDIKIDANRIICKTKKYIFYYDVNPFYVDTLSEEVIKDFINEAYEPYYKRFGTTFEGFFTDEPQISRNGIPWSLTLPEQFKKEYGKEIFNILPLLFNKGKGYQQARIQFWRLITKLFSNNFMKQIYDWCNSRQLKLTGHLLLEESLLSQLTTNGACMPHYEYFNIPGMDWLGRNINNCLTHHQVASVASQLGKQQVISETFALCGHNVGFEELKRNYEWMMVRGINLLCPHLEGYTLRGIRKRDYPPAMYYQQPWWNDYKTFTESMSRVGMILSNGKDNTKTLLMHNMTSSWICFDNNLNTGLESYNTALLDAIEQLEHKHVMFHLGDEIIMERHAKVVGNKLHIGKAVYDTIVLPKHIDFFDNTKNILQQFKQNGGKIISIDAVKSCNIIDNPDITYTSRAYSTHKVYYFVNSTSAPQKAKINKGSYAIDIITGQRKELELKYTFAPHESLLVVDDGSRTTYVAKANELCELDLDGQWNIKHVSENSLTLDKCTYWFDGKLQQRDGYILNVAQRANDLKREVDIKCQFKVNIQYIPTQLYLACETPEMFDIYINGHKIVKKDCGYFKDVAFRKLDISKYVKLGNNIIELNAKYKQSAQTYANMQKATQFESELNKLSYDMEVEVMYLVGDFGVKCNGEFTQSINNSSFFDGEFEIVEPTKSVVLSNIEKQGFTFFSGEMKLNKTYNLDHTNYKVKFNKKGINVIKLKINGKQVSKIMWEPFEVDLSKYLKIGKNQIEITIINNLRNLLGPHHHILGEIYFVAPSSFYDEKCVWNYFTQGNYDPRYNFVETGLI